MNKILMVAMREFVATALTKGFIIGGFVVPVAIVGVLIVVLPFLMKSDGPRLSGTMALVDRSGLVAGDIESRLETEVRRAREAAQVEQAQQMAQQMGTPGSAQAAGMAEAVMVSPLESIRIERLAGDLSDGGIDDEKAPLREPVPREGEAGRLALAVIEADAIVSASPDEPLGGFELFIRNRLDDRIEGELREVIREAIRERRMREAGFDPEAVARLTQVDSPRSVEVTEQGERKSLGEARVFISFGFMAVLMISVMIGSQYLLTTTVEEKSSRIVEVLLSSVSPHQLMTGKILGQFCVGLSILVIYAGMGGGALLAFNLGSFLGPVTFIYMIVFFLLAYIMIASLTAAVGAAVNDMREAQSLQTPVMLMVMVPYLLWLPISRNPSGTFATVCSFIPPISPFTMMLRLTSNEPPPTWQVLTSIAVGAAACVGFMWIAGKIFRVGLLMYGKPPNFMTLVRWVRMA